MAGAGEPPGDAARIAGLAAAADEGDHDALDLEFFPRDQMGVAGIFGAEKGFAALQDEGFQRDLSVDHGRDDVAGARFDAVLDDRDVAVEDAFAGHGIAADAEGEGAGAGADAEGFEVDDEGAFVVLRAVFGVAGGDGAEDGDGAEAVGGDAGGGGLDGEEAAGAAEGGAEVTFLAEGGDVGHGGVGAAEAEVGGDFADGGGATFGGLLLLDEIEHLLLTFGEAVHTILYKCTR